MRHQPEQEVIVRFVRTDTPAHRTRIAAAERILSAEEREPLARFRSSRTWYDYVAAHALARMTLAEWSECDPKQLRLRQGEHGRWQVARPWRARGLEFSVAYADGLALCAATYGCAIGADVESQRVLGQDPMGVAAAVCTEREHATLRSLPRSLRADRVLAVWTLKEAVAQATGAGVQLSLSSITIGDMPAVCAHAGGFSVPVEGADQSRWRLTSLRFAPHYVAAVAVPERLRDRVTVRFEEGHFGHSRFHAWSAA